MSEQKNNLPPQVQDLITRLYDKANLTDKKTIDELHRNIIASMVSVETPPLMLTESMVSSREKKPFVIFQWGTNRCELTPDEARAYALSVLASAEAAVHDAATYDGVVNGLKLEKETGFNMIRVIREHRKKFESQEGSTT